MKGKANLSHIAFWVGDMQKSLAFYRDLLGFPLMYSLDRGDGAPWLTCLQAGDSVYLELFPAEEMPDAGNGGQSYFHFAIEVEDIRAVMRELEERGVKVYRYHDDAEPAEDLEPIRPKCNSYVCWIKDPDGNAVELIEYTEESLQIRHGLKR